MFDSGVSLSPILSDDDDLLSPWDDPEEAPVPLESDEEEGLVVPKPPRPIGDDEDEDDDGDLGLLPDDFEEDM